MHKTLARQMSHHIKDPENISQEWKELLETISLTYENFDKDRLLIERSLEISSREMRGFISMLQATLDSTSEGILVVDEHGLLTHYNKRFEEIWEIPEEILKTRESERAITYALGKVIDKEGLRKHISDANNSSSEKTTYVVKFNDGRTVEINSRPQILDDTRVGRVWSSRDVTEHLRAQEELTAKLEALERLNKAMIDREIKMIELKKKIAALEEGS